MLQSFRLRPDAAYASKSAIASDEGSSSVRLDVLRKHLATQAHRAAHAWAFPQAHEKVQVPSVANSAVGKMLVSSEVANRTQFVAYFRLIFSLVIKNVRVFSFRC